MEKTPRLRMKRWVSWQSLSIVALVALMLAVSYFGTIGPRMASVMVPMNRVPLEDTREGTTEQSPSADTPDTTPQVPAPVIAQAQSPFDGYRQTIAEARETAAALLSEVIADASANADTVQEAIRQKAELARTTELEAVIEAMLRARGFEDVLCTVRKGSVSVVVRSAGLTQQQAAQILDIAVTQTGEAASNVRIIPAE